MAGGAVVSGSFPGHAQEWLRSALAELGPGFAGVTQLPPTVPDEQVRELHGSGVRAVRFTLRRGADADPAGIERLARRVHDLAGWHAGFYADAAALEHLAPVLHDNAAGWYGLPRPAAESGYSGHTCRSGPCRT